MWFNHFSSVWTGAQENLLNYVCAVQLPLAFHWIWSQNFGNKTLKKTNSRKDKLIDLNLLDKKYKKFDLPNYNSSQTLKLKWAHSQGFLANNHRFVQQIRISVSEREFLYQKENFYIRKRISISESELLCQKDDFLHQKENFYSKKRIFSSKKMIFKP